MSPDTQKQPRKSGQEITAPAMPKSKRRVVVCMAQMCRRQARLPSHRCSPRQRRRSAPSTNQPNVIRIRSCCGSNLSKPHADPEQDNHDNKPSIDGLIRPKDTADRLAEPVRYEIKAPAPSDGRTATSRPRVLYRADSARVTGQTKWLKPLWDRLTSGRQFRIAFLHFSGSRR